MIFFICPEQKNIDMYGYTDDYNINIQPPNLFNYDISYANLLHANILEDRFHLENNNTNDIIVSSILFILFCIGNYLLNKYA